MSILASRAEAVVRTHADEKALRGEVLSGREYADSSFQANHFRYFFLRGYRLRPEVLAALSQTEAEG